MIGLNIAHEYGIPTTNVKVNDVGAALSSIVMKPKGSFWFLHSLIFVMGTWLVVNMLGHLGFICKILLSVTLLSVLIVVFGFGVKWVAVIYFHLGILISRTSCQLSFMSPLKAIALFSILSLNGDGSSVTEMLSEPLLVLFVVGVFYWMYSCFSLGKDCRITSFFNRLGRCSMPILLFHAVFVVSIKYAAIQVFPSVSVPAFISFIISLVYALICCELCLRLSMLMTRFGLDGLLLGKNMMSVYHLK